MKSFDILFPGRRRNQGRFLKGLQHGDDISRCSAACKAFGAGNLLKMIVLVRGCRVGVGLCRKATTNEARGERSEPWYVSLRIST